jgi:hypothetical protein
VSGPETRRWLREKLFGGRSDDQFGYQTGGDSGAAGA